jgi:hypothetical protein
MATTNITLTANWTQIIDDGDDFLLSLADASGHRVIAVATAASAPAATLRGHQLSTGSGGNDAITRAIIGPGDVWARSQGSPAVLAVTAWSA